VDVSDDNDFSFVEKREPGQYDLHEFYADEFAGALLMPEQPFMKMLDENVSLIEIAARFGVSLDAARKRRERLRRNPPEKD
jgi:Zn-dependent peptidase ImmA (M78 family)